MRAITFHLTLLLLFSLPASAQSGNPPAAAIASAHPLATRAGLEVLQKGGNAFDAAVAITAALAVVEPMGSGLGGGGFWLLHRARDGFETMVDGRERAPLAAFRDMYLDQEGNPVPRISLNGPLAAAIPGTPAALDHITRNYGRLSLKQNLAPAIRLARQGFPVYERYRRMVSFRFKPITASPAAANAFLKNGLVPDVGHTLIQTDLARTLNRIARKGRKGFYDGPLARSLVKGVRAAGGIWTEKDLKQYRVVERTPITGSFRGLKYTSAALPSSGGIVLKQTLNILHAFPLARLSGSERKHLIIESMRRAHRDRARYLGDGDFINVDINKLTGRNYATFLRNSITHAATPSAKLGKSKYRPKGRDTTHFSVIDQQGNRVAATLSINYPFGSAFVPPGTGVVLNNEMDDFSVKPGVANAYGLVGNEANAIAPGKRPLSSMSPTFLESKDKVVVLGTPGGSRIISMVLLVMLEVSEDRGGPADWVALKRFHHQYLPDVVQYEAGALTDKEIRNLVRRGHKLERRKRPYGNMHVVVWDKKNNKVLAASDPRGEGLALSEAVVERIK
ncbi:MAG: gamma-glutamyltransferase [Acidiferrobacterales bacterium]